jgi:TolB-like protein/Tfp pilus assembly protein PilF
MVELMSRAMPAPAEAGPVLALLPFASDGPGADTALFARGFVEDLCAELSRFPVIEVISPASGAAVAGLPEAEVAARLGASHLLRGSLRRAGERWRVTVGLVEAEGARQIWSETFDLAASEFFDVQDEIVARTAASLSARLGDRLLANARRKPTESLAAWEAVLRGMQALQAGTLEADLEARGYFERALAIDPLCARAKAGLSLSHFNEWSCQFWDRFEESATRAYAHAHDALDLDDRDPMVHVVIGRVLLYRRRFEQAAWYCDRALALCPNDAETLIQLSLADVYLGDPVAAAEKAEKALRLNPYHPDHYQPIAGLAYFFQRDFTKALAVVGRSASVPFIDIPAYTAMALAFTGEAAAARATFADYEALFRQKIKFGAEPEPGEAARWLLDVNPYRRDEDVALIREGFRLIGAACLAPPAPATAAESAAILRAGRGWEVTWEGRRTLVPDMKGLHDLTRLIERPGEAVHCLDLAERVEEAWGGDEALDGRARAALKARIRDIEEDRAEAEAMNDIGRAERLAEERDRLVETLAAALGLGGRSRRVGSLTERARTAVTWRLRHAVRRLAAEDPALGRHLENSLRTGTFCTYQPERPVAWRFGGAGG